MSDKPAVLKVFAGLEYDPPTKTTMVFSTGSNAELMLKTFINTDLSPHY
jgi:hypothetical protein